MNRRNFLKGLSCTALSGILSGCVSPRVTPGIELPNVLLILSDDLCDRVGFLERDLKAFTPNLNSLAESSLNFTRAYSQAPICNPSRASFMTGLHPMSTNVYGNKHNWIRMLPNAWTLPRAFKSRGYLCKAAGKIDHQKWEDHRYWHQYETVNTNPALNDPIKDIPYLYPELEVQSDLNQYNWKKLSYGKEQMGDWNAADYIIDWIRDNPNQPFFFAYGSYKPHMPFFLPEEYWKLYENFSQMPTVLDGDIDDLPWKNILRSDIHKKIVESGQWQNFVNGYLASASFADECIGKVLTELRESSFYENTIIILISDHGFHLGEKQHWGKSSLWEQSTRVPFLLSVPGYREYREYDGLTGPIDIFPTLSDYCNLAIQGLEGISLKDVVEGGSIGRDHIITSHRSHTHAVRTDRWRYIVYGDGSQELYDHDIDPYEWNNLATDPVYLSLMRELHGRIPHS